MLRVFASAKVNLWLHIADRRPDGFHEIETLMVPIGLRDEIQVERAGTTGLLCSDPSVPDGEENLAIRAVRILEAETGRSLPVQITLQKNIPAGAGLAGGSSDAVAVLKAVNSLYELNLDESRLIAAAARLGSDTAFFVRGAPALCRGRGEILAGAGDLRPLRDRWLLLLKPPFGVPTPWAYSRWAALRPPAGESQSLGPFTLRNDLETPVFEKYTALPVMKQWLLAQPGTEAALMSGSGSTLFAILPSEETGWELEKRARAFLGTPFWTCLTRFQI
ncbi:MAG TPA: 4-(cytidine 5'-diphospho)-2-C-methyl-D-erythritol kinase [Chthoniobacterales bacterium]